MKRFGAIALLALLIGIEFPASATTLAPAAAKAQSGDSHRAAAEALVRLVTPSDRVLAQEMRGWELAMHSRMNADPTIAKLEAEFPGIGNAGIAAARPSAEAHIRKVLKAATQLKVDVTARLLSSAEIAEAQAFYSSPLGSKIIRGMTEPEQAQHLIKRMSPKLEEGDNTVTEQDSKVAIAQAARSVMADVSGTDAILVMKFESSPLGKKLTLMAEEVQRETLKLINTPDPAFSEQQNKALTDAMLAFAERRQAK